MTKKTRGKDIVERQEEPTPTQQTVIDRFAHRRDEQPRVPRVIAEAKPNQPVLIAYPTRTDALGTMLAFGTTEPAVAVLLLNHLMNSACDGNPSDPPTEPEINRVLAAVHGIGASDHLEAMLATQMVATHLASMRALRRLKGADTIAQQDSNGNLAVKLLRTFTAQVEALQRYRGERPAESHC